MYKQILESNSNNYNKHWLDRYIKFISLCVNTATETTEYTERHHICPASLFPEYKNLRQYTWNLAVLTHRQHFIAHYMLAKAFGGRMWFAFIHLCKGSIKSSGRTNRSNSRLFEIAKIKSKNIKLEDTHKKKIKDALVKYHSNNQMSDETRSKMSRSAKVRSKRVKSNLPPMNEETKKKISEAKMGKSPNIPEETRKVMNSGMNNPRSKWIWVTPLGCFYSIELANQLHGISNVKNRCLNKIKSVDYCALGWYRLSKEDIS